MLGLQTIVIGWEIWMFMGMEIMERKYIVWFQEHGLSIIKLRLVTVLSKNMEN